MNSRALILVDFEKEWIDINSEYHIGDISKVISKTNELIDYSREKGFKIIFVKHIEKDSQNEFAQGSQNIEIINELKKQSNDTVIEKYKISAFYNTNLEREINGINKIIVCGILTNLCVRSLIQDAYDRDYDISVIRDCCVAFDQETQKFTFKDLQETREEIIFFNLIDFIVTK